VTAAVAKTAIGGIQVCATSSGGEFVEQCATTDSSGEYTVAGLTTGEYTVRFYDPSDGYLIQYYEDKSSFSEANKVSVTEGSTSPGINAAMQANETATKPVNSEAPQVSGTPAVGQTLLCSAGSWSGTPTPTFTYQWLREGAAITGATSESYTVQTSDQGHGLVCEVTASNSAGKTAAQSTPVSIPAEAKPVNTGAPQVAGTPAVGSILSCSAGSWSGTPAPTFAYQWLREGAAITGATSSSYTVQSADQGHGLVCEVTASNSAGKTSADSTAVQIPAPAPAKPVNTEAPQVSGQTLSCSTGSWSGTPAPTFAYRWLREGSAIAGEASSTYVVQAVDEGHTLTCEVTAKNSVGEKSATSTGVAIPASSSGGTQPGGSTGGGSTGGGGSTTPATTPATPEGSGGVLAAKAISGNVSLAGFTITVQSSGKAAVKLGCASTTTCAGQLTLTAKTKGNGKKKAKTETIGTASFSIPAGETVTVKLALTGAGKALLSAAHGHLSATLTILKSSPAPAATQTDGVHLVLQKAVKAKKSKV